jgi:hypothetical protein
MSDGDLTKYLPEWAEPGAEAYLVGESPDEPSPGEVKIKKLSPGLIEVNSKPGQGLRVLFKVEQGSETWRFTLSWAAKMFNCFRLNMDFQEDRVVMTGEIMHAGKRTPGMLALVKGDNTSRLEFSTGFAFLNGEYWSLQLDKPDWSDDDDDDW